MSEAVFAKLVSAVGEAALARTSASVVATLQAQPSALDGEGSELNDVWLQFAIQVQGDPTGDWDLFVLHIRQVIESALFGLPEADQQALMLRTPVGRAWLCEPDGDEIPIDTEALIDCIYSAVRQVAGDWEDGALQRALCPGSEDFDFDDYRDDEPGDDVHAGGHASETHDR